MASLNPYLSFNGNCREAMEFYKHCLDADLQIHTVGSMPEMAAQMPAAMKDAILHAELRAGNLVLMASDLYQGAFNNGNTYALCVNCDTEEELNTWFPALSQGGQVTQPVADMPWGARYGEFTDKYGKKWLFSYQIKK